LNDTSVLEIATKMMTVTAELAAPLLIVSLAIGLAVSLLQSVTQIQESSLTFVPKLAGIALTLVLAGHWMINALISFTDQMFQMIPQLINS
jgi:flagellar biosynthetic protein FliQ